MSSTNEHTAVINAVVPKHIKKEFKKVAKEQDTTMCNLVRILVTNYLKEYQGGKQDGKSIETRKIL